jgi:predicted alpha/beta-fold hydrolase
MKPHRESCTKPAAGPPQGGLAPARRDSAQREGCPHVPAAGPPQGGFAPDYLAPPWLRNPHLQTIWPTLVPATPRVTYRRERWTTPDDDFIDLDWAVPAVGAPTADGPLVALFHGLEGNSGSHYARALMADLLAMGWRGVVVHWRGCSGEPNLLARAYHSGDSAEVDWILRRLRPDFAAGVSLGANALLKWLGEQGSGAGFIRAAAGVSAPQDLHAGAIALSRGFNRLYCWNFMNTLKRKSVLKLDRFPDLYDRRQLLAARTFFDFDDLVTAPLHGFESAIDYWTRSSCKQYLGGIAVPTLVLNARNDPFLPEVALARASEVSVAVTLDYPADGGHVGFVHGRIPGTVDWLPRRLTAYFKQFV